MLHMEGLIALDEGVTALVIGAGDLAADLRLPLADSEHGHESRLQDHRTPDGLRIAFEPRRRGRWRLVQSEGEP